MLENDLLSTGKLVSPAKPVSTEDGLHRLVQTRWIAEGSTLDLSQVPGNAETRRIVLTLNINEAPSKTEAPLHKCSCHFDISGDANSAGVIIHGSFDPRDSTVHFVGGVGRVGRVGGKEDDSSDKMFAASLRLNDQGFLQISGELFVYNQTVVIDAQLVPANAWLLDSDNSYRTIPCFPSIDGQRVAISPNADHVASISRGSLTVWEIESSRKVISRKALSDITSLRFVKQKLLAVATESNGVSFIDLESGQTTQQFPINGVQILAADDQENRFVCMVETGNVHQRLRSLSLLELDSGDVVELGVVGYPYKWRFTNDDIQLASVTSKQVKNGHFQSEIEVRSSSDPVPLASVTIPDGIDRVQFADEGDQLYAAAKGSYFKVDFSSDTDGTVQKLSHDVGSNVQWSTQHDPPLELEVNDDRTIRVFDPLTNVSRILGVHLFRPDDLVQSPDRRFVSSVSGRCLIKVWDLNKLPAE